MVGVKSSGFFLVTGLSMVNLYQPDKYHDLPFAMMNLAVVAGFLRKAGPARRVSGIVI